MTRFTKVAAALAALALTAGASAASAQSYGFTHSGELVTARGQVVADINASGFITTTCNIELYGAVSSDGKSIIFDAYYGVKAPGNAGNLSCDDNLDVPIVVTASGTEQVNLDELLFGVPGVSVCQEMNYSFSYVGNVVTLNGEPLGLSSCKINGSLALTTDDVGAAVNIVALP